MQRFTCPKGKQKNQSFELKLCVWPGLLNGCGSVQAVMAGKHVLTDGKTSTWIAEGRGDGLPVHCGVRFDLSFPQAQGKRWGNVAVFVGFGFSQFNLLVPPADTTVLIKLILG